MDAATEGFLSQLATDVRWQAFFINFGYCLGKNLFRDEDRVAQILRGWARDSISKKCSSDDARVALFARINEALIADTMSLGRGFKGLGSPLSRVMKVGDLLFSEFALVQSGAVTRAALSEADELDDESLEIGLGKLHALGSSIWRIDATMRGSLPFFWAAESTEIALFLESEGLDRPSTAAAADICAELGLPFDTREKAWIEILLVGSDVSAQIRPTALEGFPCLYFKAWTSSIAGAGQTVSLKKLAQGVAPPCDGLSERIIWECVVSPLWDFKLIGRREVSASTPEYERFLEAICPVPPRAAYIEQSWRQLGALI